VKGVWADGGVGSASVVVGDPGVEAGGTLCGGGVGPGVGPVAQAGLDEALDLAVGARGVGPGADVAQARAGTGVAEGAAAVAAAIVGHDPLDAAPQRANQGMHAVSTAAVMRAVR
jgi:hypothetical protein